MRAAVTILAACVLSPLALAACEQGDDGAAVQLTPTSTAQADPLDHPSLEVPPRSASVKRLTVSQLRNSIPVVAGAAGPGAPIAWRITRDGAVIDALGDRGVGRTLGEPDYVEVLQETAEPTPLYVKFMDDMGRDVCAQMVAADTAAPSAEARSLTRFANIDASSSDDEVNANLRYLKLRFLGERLADEDDGGVADLKTVYDTVAAVEAPAEAWHAVCVAMLTSPAFHLY